jgi:hypothetical protein
MTEEIATLCRTGSVLDYSDRFLTLECHDVELTESQQVQLSLTRLQNPLKTDVALRLPQTLNNAVMLATVYEHQ